MILCRFHRERTSIREVTERLNAGQDGEKRFGIVKLPFTGMATLLDTSCTDGDNAEDIAVIKSMQKLMESTREDGLRFTHCVYPVLGSCVCTESALEEQGKRLVSCVVSSDIFDINKNSGIKFACVLFSGRGLSKNNKGDRIFMLLPKGFQRNTLQKLASRLLWI